MLRSYFLQIVKNTELVYLADGQLTIKVSPQLRRNEFLKRNKRLNFSQRKAIKKTKLQKNYEALLLCRIQ